MDAESTFSSATSAETSLSSSRGLDLCSGTSETLDSRLGPFWERKKGGGMEERGISMVTEHA